MVVGAMAVVHTARNARENGSAAEAFKAQYRAALAAAHSNFCHRFWCHNEEGRPGATVRSAGAGNGYLIDRLLAQVAEVPRLGNMVEVSLKAHSTAFATCRINRVGTRRILTSCLLHRKRSMWRFPRRCG